MAKYPIVLILLGSLLTLQLITTAQNFDIDWLRSLNHNESQFKNDLFHFTSHSVTIVNIAAPVGVFAAGLAKKDKQLQLNAAYMVGAYALSSVVTHGLKFTVNRDRPFVTYPDIIKKDEGGSSSFPSGHTSAAFATATSMSLYFPKWYVIVPAYAWATTVGVGRIYQGVHYPTDVFAGAVVGPGSAYLTYKFQHWMDKRKKNKSQSVKL